MCYKTHTVPKKWRDAGKICKEEGSSLVIVRSDKEANFLVEEMAKYPPEKYTEDFDKYNFQVGFSDLLNNGVYMTIEGLC
jgi:glutathionyl-hydroquinone reductase